LGGFSEEIAAIEDEIDPLTIEFNRENTELEPLQDQLTQMKQRFAKLKHFIQQKGPPAQAKQQEISAKMQKRDEVLKTLLLDHENSANELTQGQDTRSQEKEQLEKLTTDLLGMEIAYDQEKTEAETFCEKIKTWMASSSERGNAEESLLELGEQADGGLKEIAELMAMTNKLMVLRKIQDKNYTVY